MPNVMYTSGKVALLSGNLDWDASNMYVALVDGTYVFDDDHLVLDDVDGIIGTPAPLAGRVVTDIGAGDANDVTTMVIPLGVTCRGLVIYKNTLLGSTSTLVFFWDTNDDCTPINRPGDDGAVPVIWSNGADKLYQIL